MISFRLGSRIIAIQSAAYVLPVYQKVETGAHGSTYPGDSGDTENSSGTNESVITHRLLIPCVKVSVVRSEPEFNASMFEERK